MNRRMAGGLRNLCIGKKGELSTDLNRLGITRAEAGTSQFTLAWGDANTATNEEEHPISPVVEVVVSVRTIRAHLEKEKSRI